MRRLTILFALFVFVISFTAVSAAPDNSTKININSASAKKLTELKGIGKVISKRIIDYRKKNGRFERPRDIMKVDGIGEKTFLDIRDKITTTPQIEKSPKE